MPVHVVNHPVITHKMNILRSRHTETPEFRQVVSEMTLLLAYEATRDLETREIEVETPLTTMKSQSLSGGDFIIAPVLRAGLGMVSGMLMVFPHANVAHLGLKRDEETAMPETYYYNYPSPPANPTRTSTVFVVDPMLATAGSLCAAIDLVKKNEPTRVIAVCLIAAPEGKAKVEKEHPDVDVYVGAMDERLNENFYIMPGLGDAGDRMFGTT